MPAHEGNCIWEWKNKANFGLCLCWWYPIMHLLPWLSDAILVLDQCLEAIIDPECSNDVDLSAPHFPYITALLCELQWLLVSFPVQFKVLGIPFRALNGMRPGYLHDCLFLRIFAYPTRSDRFLPLNEGSPTHGPWPTTGSLPIRNQSAEVAYACSSIHSCGGCSRKQLHLCKWHACALACHLSKWSCTCSHAWLSLHGTILPPPQSTKPENLGTTALNIII